ncbi:hypothetical protein LOAG_08947, partial [Loa loa]
MSCCPVIISVICISVFLIFQVPLKSTRNFILVMALSLFIFPLVIVFIILFLIHTVLKFVTYLILWQSKLFQKFEDLKIIDRSDGTWCGGNDLRNSNSNDSKKIYKWKNKNLTYSIGTVPKELSRRIVRYDNGTKENFRDVMKRAFEVWSTVTQLNFLEVPQNGNIKIDFVRGEHGDGYTFDGP